MQVKDAIKKRKSVSRFMDKKPNWRKVVKAIDAMRYAPMAGNQFSLKIILVQDEKKIREFGKCCQQSFVGRSKCVVVVVSDDAKVKRSYEDRGEKFARQQAGAAIQNFLLALEDQGLATTWVGAFVDSQVKRALDIPADWTVEAILPVGVGTKIETKKKTKKDLEDVIYFDKFKNKFMKPKQVSSLASV
jgi:nitroreductase